MPTTPPWAGRSSRISISTCSKGEIVGFAGLMGSGRTELALSIFGNPDQLPHQAASCMSRARRSTSAIPQDAIQAGMAYVTEDRKGDGLILIQDVKQNITLANLREIANRGVVDNNAEVKLANEYKNFAQYQDAHR